VSLATIITTIVGILTLSSSLFIVSSGLTLVFGAVRIMNIAHGSFYMYGAYIATTLAAYFSGAGFWVALIAGPLVVGAVAAIVELLILRKMYAQGHMVQLIATFALLLIFANIALLVWGADVQGISPPDALLGAIQLGGAVVPDYNLFVAAVGIVVGVALWLLLANTTIGWRVRAAVDDPELLAASGANVPLLFTGVFVLGAMLAALSGVVVAPQQAVQPGMDAQILVSAFIVTVIGGLGSIAGAAVGAIVIGVVETFGVMWAPAWSGTLMYVLMIVVLAIRPWGLFGTPER
jgi:branched-subunit amino acid ABC-type transport system permease component